MSERKRHIPQPRSSRPGAPRSESSLRARTAAQAPSAEARATAILVTLVERDAASVASVMAKLPDPAELPRGALVILPGTMASSGGSLTRITRSVLSVLGRTKTVGRAHRCSALVARGYVDVGATGDETCGDLAWGYAPP